MPSTPNSHGGVLYYVVAVPKESKPEEARNGPLPLSGSTTPGTPAAPSTDSGWDNPFRPDGDLSREADEIVELIKGGKPITPTPLGPAAPASPVREASMQAQHSSPVTSTPHKNGANGSANKDPAAKPSSPGNLDVTRGTVSGGEQVEHVTLKKKPKCKCCIVQ
ncbi:hypothetical protein KUF71_002797 [Frankliniella fusca]|uniref:Uncharacterized protein n=1 Tax=Frankliniella fusca TaxID=407009 RepID=A0AAE1HTP1_9NEOP|nr:hypothetical protein KUF71_002797 [Frankliniella fusca]